MAGNTLPICRCAPGALRVVLNTGEEAEFLRIRASNSHPLATIGTELLPSIFGQEQFFDGVWFKPISLADAIMRIDYAQSLRPDAYDAINSAIDRDIAGVLKVLHLSRSDISYIVYEEDCTG